MLSKLSQTQKGKYRIISLTCMKKVKLIKAVSLKKSKVVEE